MIVQKNQTFIMKLDLKWINLLVWLADSIQIPNQAKQCICASYSKNKFAAHITNGVLLFQRFYSCGFWAYNNKIFDLRNWVKIYLTSFKKQNRGVEANSLLTSRLLRTVCPGSKNLLRYFSKNVLCSPVRCQWSSPLYYLFGAASCEVEFDIIHTI